MPYQYHSDTGDAINAFGQMGGSLNSLAYALPQLRMQADRFQQEMMLRKAEEILRKTQAQEMQARERYYGARTAESEQKTKQGQGAQQAADLGGQATMLAQTVGNPSLDTQAGFGQAADLLRSQGLAPQGGFDMPRDAMVEALRAIGARAVMQNALGSPSAAAQLMIPRNIGQGGTGMNAFGTVGVGQPRPIDVAPGHVVYPGGGASPLAGMTALPPGYNLMDLTSGLQNPPTIAQGQPKPFHDSTWQTLVNAMLNQNYLTMPEDIQGMIASGVTNLAPTQLRGGGGPQVIKTKQEYDALPSGTVYIGPDGKTATKR